MRGRREAEALNSLEHSCTILMSLSLEIFLFPQHTKYWLGSLTTYFRIVPLSTLSSRISYTLNSTNFNRWGWGYTLKHDVGLILTNVCHVPTSGLSPGEESKTTEDKHTSPISPHKWSHWCPVLRKDISCFGYTMRPVLPLLVDPARYQLKPWHCNPNTSYPNLSMVI